MTTKITNANITNTGVSAGSYTNTNLTVNAQGQITAASNGTGGGGTPGGSDTQVQFNDSGSFGGDAGLTYNKTTDVLTVAGAFSAPAGTASAPSITTTGDTNTGVYFPAADTAAITTGGSERMRIDSSGNVGIGGAPAASFLTGASLLQLGAGSMVFGSSATSIEVSTNQFINAAGSARTYLTTGTVGVYQQSSGRHRFYSAASGSAGAALTLTTVLEVDKDKTLALQGGSSTTGAGIAFPASENLSTNANTLDDYEEGVWTPNQGAGLTVTGTFSSAGTYTKVGNLVYVRGYVQGSTTVSVTAGGIISTNLPFTNAAAACGGNATNFNVDQTSGVYVAASTTFYATSALTASSQIFFGFTYRV